MPDQNPKQFLPELVTIINDDSIKITKIMSFTTAITTTHTSLYEAREKSATKLWVTQFCFRSVLTDFTDGHFSRDINIVSYGFAPFLYLEGAAGPGVNGNNKRISI